MTRSSIESLVPLLFVLAACGRGSYSGAETEGEPQTADDPCPDDDACRGGFVCNLDTGLCEEDLSATPHGSEADDCAVDANCLDGLDCVDGTCVDPTGTGAGGSSGTGGSSGGGGGSGGGSGGGGTAGGGGSAGTGGSAGGAGSGGHVPSVDVGCLSNSDCGGDVCCTYRDEFASRCESEAICTGGNPAAQGKIQACLTDEQCEARDPARGVCCHFFHGSTCAASCEPFDFCDDSTDCAGTPSTDCCTPHPFYGVGVCVGAIVDPSECL